MAASSENFSKISLDDINSRILQFLQTAQYKEAEKLSAWFISNYGETKFEPVFYLGVALQFQGRVSEALKIFQQALALNQQNINALQAIASCHEQLGNLQEAYQELLKVLEIAPSDAVVHANLGAISEKLMQATNALTYYDQALELDPKNHTSLLNRGSLLASMRKQMQGLAHCRKAYKTHPQSIGILFNLVDALLGTFQYEEALTYCELGLSMQPRHANLLFKKGLILSCLKQYESARRYLAEAQVIDPKVLSNFSPSFGDNKSNLGAYLDPFTLYLDAMYEAQEKCFWDYRAEYINTWNEAIENRNENGVIRNAEFSFHILSLHITAENRLCYTRNLTEGVQDLAWLEGSQPFTYNTTPRDKIRIGYCSSDFRMHPTGLLSKQIYGLHNKEQFEIYIYSFFNAPQKNHVRAAVENDATVFRDVSELSDREFAQQINQDEIDILIDLNGYTAKLRSKVFAMRPAPIQVSYLAYLQSMGADFIDYVLLDGIVCPPKKEKDWQEKVARLPHSFYVYDTDTSCAPINKTRAEFGLPKDGMVYCCLNTNYKIEPEIFTVWMNVLKAVPNSVLWLVSNDELTIANLQNEAAKRGVAGERIVFAEPLPHAEHLLRYQLADLFIDTFWYGGHTTGLDAMWQGLPVLCCVGEVPTSRVGASYQYVLEMPEMVAESFEEYQAKAIYYGTNPEALKKVKQKLKEKIRTTPLFDTPLTVKHIEKAYQMMWQRYQDGLPPATFDVPDLRVTH